MKRNLYLNVLKSAKKLVSLNDASEVGRKQSPGRRMREFFQSKRHMRPIPRLAISQSLMTACTLIALSTTQMAEARQANSAKLLVIHSDNGGRVAQYAIDVSRAKKQGVRVQVKGKCQSACTLYLALPTDQICISRGASFVFHKAHSSSSQSNRWGTEYMWKKYPAWVRDWIASKGGLSHSLIKMNHDYASRYIPACKGKSTTPRQLSKIDIDHSALK